MHLTRYDLLKLFFAVFFCGIIFNGVTVWMAAGVEAGVNAMGVSFSFLLAAFSLGKLWESLWNKGPGHETDPCVLAGEHIEGCIYMEDKPEPITVGQAPQAPKAGALHYDAKAGEMQVFDGTDWEPITVLPKSDLAKNLNVDAADYTKAELIAMLNNDTPKGSEMLNTELAMCAECGNLLDDSRDQRRHMGRQVDRCLNCGKHGLCLANPDGPHQRIVWPEDPDYDPSKHVVGPLPEKLRVGYCPGCRTEFRESGEGFTELTWEEVGFMWAAESDPSILERRHLDATVTWVEWSPQQAPGGLWVGFDGGDNVGYHFVHYPPLVRGSLLHQMLASMGREDNADYDDDDLRIQLPRRKEHGPFRLTLDKHNEIVAIKALPCPQCGGVHKLEQGGRC